MTMWIKDPLKWEELDIINKLILLKKHYCTGPCGQSSSVLQTRTATEEVINEAIVTIQMYDDFTEKLSKVFEGI